MHSMPYSLAQAAFQPEDDVDRLFNRLNQLEPPGELVARILTHIGRLPGPSALPTSAPASGEECRHQIVRNEWRDPS
jgi:hypothetical protein